MMSPLKLEALCNTESRGGGATEGTSAAANWGTAANYADAPPMPIFTHTNSRSQSPLGHWSKNIGSGSVTDGYVGTDAVGLFGGSGSASYIYLCNDDSGGGIRYVAPSFLHIVSSLSLPPSLAQWSRTTTRILTTDF